MKLEKKTLKLEGIVGSIHETREKSSNPEGLNGTHEMQKSNKLEAPAA